ncbi:ATP-grasp domain-containing protein [Winogradskyella schleiferi]|uniref:ATP-grasp domain-containing protein n=1 Tax=Winogradskyella schleiferi TaxID=2686078 RepID=UPI0015BBEBDC|nr:hypothetical protein [Winogradskyella schleiferi]
MVSDSKIAIHYREGGYAKRWIEFCQENNLNFKTVNCYSNTIVSDLEGVDVLLWHHHRYEFKNAKIAEAILTIAEHKGITVFPNKMTRVSFDEKIIQKYLLESVEAPFPKTFVSFDEEESKTWLEQQNQPVVFKLSKGAGSKNVRLVNSSDAKSIIHKMHTKGIESFKAPLNLNFKLPLKSILYNFYRYFSVRIPLAKMKNKRVGNEFSYSYFQEFLPKNDHDIRIVVIGDKAIGLKRLVAKNSFKASGSGVILYDHKLIPIECISKAFNVQNDLGFQCMAYDFVKHPTKGYQIVEICYGVSARAYDQCPGYWTKDLEWNPSTSVLVEDLIIKSIIEK